MKFLLHLGSFVVVVIGASQFAAAQALPAEDSATGGTMTLLARDPVRQSLCLRDGQPGMIYQEGHVRNRCSELNFNTYLPNGLSVAMEGARQGVILDLGTAEELKAKYGYQDAADRGFASITATNGKVLIQKDHKNKQEMSESDLLFGSATGGHSSLPVEAGHVYLLRITDKYDKDFELVAKLRVLAYQPNTSVKIRWQLIWESEGAKLQDRPRPRP